MGEPVVSQFEIGSVAGRRGSCRPQYKCGDRYIARLQTETTRGPALLSASWPEAGWIDQKGPKTCVLEPTFYSFRLASSDRVLSAFPFLVVNVMLGLLAFLLLVLLATLLLIGIVLIPVLLLLILVHVLILLVLIHVESSLVKTRCTYSDGMTNGGRCINRGAIRAARSSSRPVFMRLSAL